MGRNKTDIEAFIGAFNADPGGRAGLVARLVGDEGRLQLNLPGRGVARRISERLSEGPFSAFYDFEMILAELLHPRLADLKLNVIADITVNALFDEKYRMYAAEAGAALRQGGGMGPLREVIIRMIGLEGHRMAVKFCDIVVKWADPSLYRTLRPIEVCVMDMKEGRSAGSPPRLGRVTALFEEFVAREGRAAARLLLERMDWDDDLREFVPGLQDALPAGGDREEQTDPAGAGSTALSGRRGNAREERGDDEGGEARAAGAPRTRIEKYAQILKEQYLEAKDPGDEEAIRRIVDRIEEKNGKAFGRERAAEIVDEVLDVWSADPSLDGEARYLVDIIREERRGVSEGGPEGGTISDTIPEDAGPLAGEEATAVDEAPAGEEPASAGEMDALLDGLETAHDRGDLPAEAGDAEDTGEPEAPMTAKDGSAATHEAEGEGTFLDELEAVISEGEKDSGTAASPAVDEDSFLLEELVQTGGAKQKNGSGEGQDDEYLIRGSGEEEAVSGQETAMNRSSASESVEEFTIQDEILFQDDPGKHKKTRFQRPRKGTRITKIEITPPDEDK